MPPRCPPFTYENSNKITKGSKQQMNMNKLIVDAPHNMYIQIKLFPPPTHTNTTLQIGIYMMQKNV